MKNKKFRIISFKNSKPVLSAKNISKTIDDRPILQNLNFSINPSEIVGLLGPNGAGKSVTFKILKGFREYVTTFYFVFVVLFFYKSS